VADHGDEDTGSDCCDNHRKEKWDVVNTRLKRTNSFDGLKPNREIVQERVEGCTDRECKPAARRHRPLCEQAGVDGPSFGLPELNAEPDEQAHPKNDKVCDNATIRPSVLAATELQREKEADNRRDEEDGAEDVELSSHSFEAGEIVFLAGRWRRLETEQDECHGNTTNGQVDVETPSPGDVVSERTSDQRATNGGQTVHRAHDTSVGCTLHQRRRVRNDEEGAGEQTG